MEFALKVAFLGIGLMGQPMCKRLINAGFELTLWNRTTGKTDQFRQQVKIAKDAAEAIKNADIIVTMLENGDVVEQVLYSDDTYKISNKNSLFIDMSSIPPETARRHGRLIHDHGCSYIDAPVSGGTKGAETGTLSIMVGGSETQFQRADKLFLSLGDATHIGDIGSGQLCKLANQAIVGITIGAVSEALLLAAKGGANPEAVYKALGGGFAASRVLELHGRRMLDRDFKPGATARVQLKDLKTILNEAKSEGLSLPLSQQSHDNYQSLIDNGHENIDHSGLLLELERLNRTRLSTASVQNTDA